MRMKRVVLSISGSLLLQKDEKHGFTIWAETISHISKRLEMLCVVAGGGSVARDYIRMAKEIGLGREEQDMVGIAITRANALMLSLALGWNREIASSYEEIVDYLRKNGFAVCGGMVPRQSTDKVAADIAEMVEADVVLNATKVDGVYDMPPNRKGARLLDTVGYDELKRILSKEEQTPGRYALFDLAGIDVLKRNNIPLIIFNGSDAKNLVRILEGERIGTLVM